MGKARPERSEGRYDVGMSSRTLFFAFLILAVGTFALPHAAQALTIPSFGPIVPSDCQAGWGMLITVINNIIIVLLSIAIVFVAPLMIAYAGFLFVVNPVNAGGKEHAKQILTNTIVGIVISLSAWMIVAAIMAALYHPEKDGLGAWEDLMSGGPANECIGQPAVYGPAVPPPTSPPVTVVPKKGKFIYASGIDKQISGRSAALVVLMSCMEGKLTSDATITSISDSTIANGTHTFQQCAAQGKAIGCAHAANSCHYGGRGCIGFSYAIDLSGDLNALASLARYCGASALNEGNHLHASVGAQQGCGCDAGLD